MHTANFKTFVNTGETKPQELNVEYIPDSDMVIFSIAGKELFSMRYSENLEDIFKALDVVSSQTVSF